MNRRDLLKGAIALPVAIACALIVDSALHIKGLPTGALLLDSRKAERDALRAFLASLRGNVKRAWLYDPANHRA